MLCKSKLYLLTLLTLLSTVSLNAAIHTQYSETLCKPGTYLFGNQQLTNADGSGDYDKTIARLGAAGDSTVTVHLLFAAQKAVAYAATIEPGQTYLFGCQKLIADATETNTLQQAGCECDSTITLTLTVQAAPPAPPTDITVSYEATITLGETYLFGCNTITPTAVGDVNDQIILPRVNGGDSIINLTLHVQDVPSQDITVSYEETITLGQTYLFGCNTITPTAVGDVNDQIILPRVNGGDSIISLTLHVQDVPSQDITVSYEETIMIGETYLFGCQTYTYTESGPQQLQQTLPRANGGDSIIICNLTVAGAGGVVMVSYEETITLGESYLFGCNIITPTAVGDVTDQIILSRVNAAGDSVIDLTLHVQDVPAQDITVSYEETITLGETYLFGCNVLTPTVVGDVTDQITIQRINGGDSIINLTLHVEQACTPYDTIAPAVTACDLYYWAEVDTTILTSGNYTHVFQSVQGCDSIVTLPVTINVHDEINAPAVTECDTYYWAAADTTILTSGTYTHVFTNIAGCDSIVTVNVTINPSYPDVTAPAVTACDEYHWIDGVAGFDTLITTSGTYTHAFQTVAGCDSIVSLTVTINTHDVVTAPEVTACDSYYWAEADTTIIESGNFTHVFTNIAGCDSIVTLPVTINTSYDITAQAVESCVSYYWAEADTTILESGNFTHVFTSIHGCDSVVTLPVTIHVAYTETADAVEDCDSYYWAAADTTITETGDYTHVFATIHGCDSIVTLPVTIYNSAASAETPITECDSYYWANADTTITTTGIYTHIFQTIHGCDSVVTLDATIYYSDSTTMEPVKECNLFRWVDEAQDFDTLITTSGTYTKVFETVHGCDSVVTVDVTISLPYVDTLEVRAYYGYRIIMINRNQINSIWENITLDSLQFDHPEYVTWHEIDLNGNDKVVATGYYYNLPSGDPLPTGYQYYAIVEIPAMPGAECGVLGRTETITIGGAAPAPALVPSLARPGQDIQVINLDPMVETTIRVFTAEGMLQKVYTSSDAESFTIKAADDYGFYLVELISNDMKSTLRYMVK